MASIKTLGPVTKKMNMETAHQYVMKHARLFAETIDNLKKDKSRFAYPHFRFEDIDNKLELGNIPIVEGGASQEAFNKFFQQLLSPENHFYFVMTNEKTSISTIGAVSKKQVQSAPPAIHMDVIYCCGSCRTKCDPKTMVKCACKCSQFCSQKCYAKSTTHSATQCGHSEQKSASG